MGMRVEQFRTGGDRNFGYLAVDESTGEAFVVDPSNSPGMLAGFAAERGWHVGYAFSTHGHEDHCNGNDEFRQLTGTTVLLFGERCPETGTMVSDGTIFSLGDSSFSIIHTPGHTEDSICILAGDALFTGDTLFVGKVGGTWSDEDARREYRSLHERLMTLPEETRVFPGHDYGTSPTSTIGREKSGNPFLLQPGVDAFIDLKRNWTAYKKTHGIV